MQSFILFSDKILGEGKLLQGVVPSPLWKKASIQISVFHKFKDQILQEDPQVFPILLFLFIGNL